MTTHTLRSLQDRRSAAIEAGDQAAWYAFDLMIGHALGQAEMYARQNPVLLAVEQHQMSRVAEIDAIYAEQVPA